MGLARPSRLASPALRLGHWLHRARLPLCLFGLITLIPLWIIGSRLTTNRSLESLFAPDDPALVDYQQLQATFGGNLVVMIVYQDDDLATVDGVRRNRVWTDRVAELSGVDGVLSIAELVDAFSYLRPASQLAWLTGPTDATTSIALLNRDDPLAVEFLDLFAGYTHNAVADTAAIVAMLSPDDPLSAMAGLRATAASMPAELAAVLVGEPVLMRDAFDLIESDGRRLAIGTILCLSLVMVLSLRDWRVVLLSIACILWATLATHSTMVVLQVEMSLVSNILTAIITVMVVAAVMHLGVRLRETTPNVQSSIASTTMGMLAIPVSWTCWTDAAGFASLLACDVRPVAEFGIMSAVAAAGVLVALSLFAPVVLSLPGGRAGDFQTDPNRLLNARLRRIAMTAIAYRRRYVALASILGLACLLIVVRLPTRASFLQNFRQSSPIVRAYDRVESDLGGAGVWDVLLPAPAVVTPKYLASVRQLEENLRAISLKSANGDQVGLTKVLSLADADAVAAQSPLLSIAGPEIRLAGMRTALPTFADALLTFDDQQPRSMRIMLRSEENLDAATKRALLSRVRSAVDSFDEQGEAGRSQPGVVTGYSVLMSRLVDGLLRDQWTALSIALLGVGVLLWIATGSWSQMLAALLVNTLPILVVLAIVGGLGDGLDLGSAMIGAVSIGLSIDGSVHLLTGFARRRQTMNARDAAVEAAADLGFPILLATGALVIGFGILVSSPFVPTSTFGLMVSATLAVSALTNLTLLPSMLSWTGNHGVDLQEST
ncbi:MAG: MMPL family transporter [Planctomycetota bacterium]